MSKSELQREQILRTNEKKWTPLLMSTGWTALPSIIMEKQQALGLDPLDFNILMQLARYWWKADEPPHPSVQTIATCVGRSRSTVQRRIREMEAGGLIRRQYTFHPKGGQKSNRYHFDGLIEGVTPFAEEKLQLLEEKQRADKRRLQRKRPKSLRLVEDDL